MGNLEHNINEAFAGRDTKTKLANKGDFWNRLDTHMHSQKGVAAFWRVAAVLLGIVLFSGTFAALHNRSLQHIELEKAKLVNEQLLSTIDSLLQLPAKTETKIQIVEKEKIVYRDRSIIRGNTTAGKDWELKYQRLVDSTEMVLANSGKMYKQEISQLTTELNEAKQELAKIEMEEQTQSENKLTAPFQLKSERVEVELLKKPTVKTPEMEIKIFQKNFIENRNNLNSTIFKK